MPVNPNEAPAGFEAVEGYGCAGCAFEALASDACIAILDNIASCVPHERNDLMSTIFVVKRVELNKPATANFPHDDMGTPV